MKVETEQNQQDSGHHKGTAAHKLKKVEAFTRGALHDGLYADERDQGQGLGRKLQKHTCVYGQHTSADTRACRREIKLNRRHHMTTTEFSPWGQQYRGQESDLIQFLRKNRYRGLDENQIPPVNSHATTGC